MLSLIAESGCPNRGSQENFYTPNELINLFNEQGFKTVKNDSFNFGQVGVFIFKK